MADHRDFVEQGKVAVGNDGVSGADFIIPVDGFASCHHNTVVGEGAAFGYHQIIPAMLKVNVGSFDPFASGLGAVPDHGALTFELESFRVQLA